MTATFDTRGEAETWALQAEAGLVAGLVAATLRPVAGGLTMASLFDRYGKEVSPDKGGGRWERVRMKAMAERYHVFSEPATAFGPVEAATWRDARLKEVAPSTVNRELNLLSAVFKMAIREWRVPGLVTNPIRAITRPRNPRSRTQRVSQEQRSAIIAHLGWDKTKMPLTSSHWTAFAFALALETAMRRGEIQNLTWQHVHLDGSFVHLPYTKNGDARDVPLSSAAVALLSLLKPGKPSAFVVPLNYNTCGRAFRKAKIAAGCPEVRFHDARREAATEFSKKLSNVLELSAVTGHRSLAALRGYYAPNVGDLAAKLG